MRIEQFWKAVTDRHDAEKDWRFGQTYFNVLAEVRPDLSERIRATDLDPFYADPNDNAFWDRLIDWTVRNW